MPWGVMNLACGAEIFPEKEVTTPPASHFCSSLQGTLKSMFFTSSRTLVLEYLS